MRFTTGRLRGTAILAGLGSACADGSDRTATPAIRDSAGVAIVESQGGGTTPWRISPVLAIGEREGDERYVFGRVADVAIGRAGMVYVLDQLAQKVLVYDAEGEYVDAIGGPGQGPGELSRFTTDVFVSGDTVFVPDYAQSRINVFPPGHNPEVVRIPPQPGGRSWSRQDDGSFVYRGLTISRNAQGIFQFWDAILSIDRTGSSQDTLVILDYEFTELGSRENIRVPLIVNSASWARLTDGRIAWTALDQEAVFVHRPDGALERIVRNTDWERRATTEAERRAMVDLLRLKLEMLGGDASAADGPNVTAPEFFPAITGIRAGPDNTFWVQRMGSVDDIDPMAINASDRSDWLGGAHWEVYDAEGRLVGPVELPRRFRITRITGEAVYGVSKGDLDVERVHRLALRQ